MTDKVVEIVIYYNHPAEGGVFVGSKERGSPTICSNISH